MSEYREGREWKVGDTTYHAWTREVDGLDGQKAYAAAIQVTPPSGPPGPVLESSLAPLSSRPRRARRRDRGAAEGLRALFAGHDACLQLG